MTGQKIQIPKGFRLKDGKLVKVATYRDASHAIRARKSKRQRPQKRIV
jgi:hypothetical protein